MVVNEPLGKPSEECGDKSPRRLKLENQNLFDLYLANYEILPTYKKVLGSMINFSEMYRPIPRGDRNFDPWGHLAGINEERSLRRTEIYLNKKDLLQSFDEKSGRRLVVTSRGHRVYYEDYPLAQLRKKPWDGYWTVLMYDFPERERVTRRMIRRRLMNLGFGCPQISILISPLPLDKPIQELLEGEGVASKVWTLRAKRILGMENREVAQRAWPILTELAILYNDLLQALPKITTDKSLLEQWREYFLAVNSADPYLPRELLPEDWPGEICEKEFLKLGPKGFLEALLGKVFLKGG